AFDPAGLAGDFAGHHRHQRALIGPDFVDQREQIRPRITFDVVFDRRPNPRERACDVANILRRDVTRICAWVDGDAVNARINADTDGVENARLAAAARIPKRRDLVDVYREPDHPRCSFTTSTISCAHLRMSSSRLPSIITRSSGSV